MIRQILSQSGIRLFFSYFIVGGVAAIAEWVTFFVCTGIANIPYHFSTVIAFIAGTFINLVLGKIFTFKKCKKYAGKKIQEGLTVFFVSAVGLLGNLIIMKIFVDVICLNTKFLMNASKIMATGIVFIWNFLIRKLVVYKDPKIKTFEARG